MTATTQTNAAMKRRTFLAAAVLAAGLGWASDVLAEPSPVDLQVVDRGTGRALPFWRQNGRLFIAGEPGARYGLRVSNHTGGRVLLVLSVDGVNVFTGETAKYDQRGYVVEAYDSYDVTGWRKSETEVAAFAFAPLSASYASRTGRPGDVGVIGMAVFRERPPAPRPYAEASRGRFEQRTSDRDSASDAVSPPLPLPPMMAPSMKAAPAPTTPAQAPSIARGAAAESSIARRTDEKLGTAHGAREWSSITLVDFVRATSRPQSVRQIEYDTAPHLLARGVTPPPSYPDYPQHRPRPFPEEPGRSGFVPDPTPGR